MKSMSLKKICREEILEKGINSWPVWEKEISSFPWTYDSREECLILEGEFTVETDDGNYLVQAGDYVVFEKGLKCRWNITKAVKKHYKFT